MEHIDMKKQSRIEFKLDGNSWVKRAASVVQS
jgi:hypothetical protein